MRFESKIGVKHNMLTAIQFIRTEKIKDRYHDIYLWECQCGKQLEKSFKLVVSPGGKTTKDGSKHSLYSCGCTYKFSNKKYFGSDARAYAIYSSNYSDGDITFEQFMKLSQMDCLYCGAKPNNEAKSRHYNKTKYSFIYNGLDRLDSSKPHNINNVVTCCWDCNQFKKDRHYQTFLDKIKLIASRKEEIDQFIQQVVNQF